MTARAPKGAATPKKKRTSPATRIADDRIAVQNAATRRSLARKASTRNAAEAFAPEDAVLIKEIDSNAANIAELEELMHYAFGIEVEDAENHLRKRDIRTHLYRACRIVRLSEIEGKLTEWRLEDPHTNVGRTASISPLQVIVIMQAHILSRRPVLFKEMASTLQSGELRGVDFEALGIVNDHPSAAGWYHRLWRAMQALMALVDATPGPRWRIPTGAEFQAILKSRDSDLCAKKAIRMDLMCNMLVAGSNRLLPQYVWDRHKGNAAVDATPVWVFGKASNPSCINPALHHLDRRSTNYDAGIYSRDGSHNGDGVKGKPTRTANELEIMIKLPNSPDEAPNFPLTATHVGFHRPGQSKDVMLKILDHITHFGTPIGTMVHDRLYSSGIKVENYHEPAQAQGWEFVSDLKSTELGQRIWAGDAIQVGGQWYHNSMPPKLRDADAAFNSILKRTTWEHDDEKDVKAKRRAIRKAAQRQFNARIDAREEYRLIRKGRPNGLTSQRYMFPPIALTPQPHPLTGVITPPDCPTTISIPWDKGLKHAQRFPHKSKVWHRWFGMRNTIEAFNSLVKDSNWGALDDPGRRRARGNTFMYLVSTMIVVLANVQKIHAFLMGMRRGIDKKIVLPDEDPRVLSSRYEDGEGPVDKELTTPKESPPPLTL